MMDLTGNSFINLFYYIILFVIVGPLSGVIGLWDQFHPFPSLIYNYRALPRFWHQNDRNMLKLGR